MRRRNQLELNVLKTQGSSRQAAPPALVQFTPRALKRLTKQVARSPKRFPERFRFRLAREEADDLRSQIATPQPELGKQDTW